MKKAICVIISLIFIITAFASTAISASASDIPSSYNNNYMNLQYITSVKSQGDYGNCWAFAAIACCEAEAVKNHGASRSATDLSELHLAYFAYNGERSTGDVITSYEPFYKNGGYSQLPIFTFSNWIGLVDESVAKYSDFTSNPSITLDDELMYGNVKYYMNGAYTYNLPDETTKVKEAIMTYGAVQTAYYSNDAYLNHVVGSTKIYAYYCPTETVSNHAVAIVGWDDNYPRSNFKSSARPKSNGAWLVKNSWGDDWGLDGYFWISYEDKSMISATAFDVTPAEDYPYDNNYQYDGGLSLTYSNLTKTSAANIFTASNNEELLAVSVTTYEKSNANYSLKIYVNPTTLTPSKFNKGTPVYEQSGIIEETGFTTIPLDSPITLNKGDVFIILIETNAFLALDSDQEIKEGNTLLVKSETEVLLNQTYFSVNDSGFYDPADPNNTSTKFNARIKAYTKNITLGDATLKALPMSSSIEYGQDLSKSTLEGGEVVDSLSNRAISGEWSFKNTNIIPENDSLVKVIFTPDNPEYDVIEAEINITVTKSTPKLVISTDKNSYKGGETVGISATIENKHSKALTDLPSVRFYYQINEGEKVFFEDSFTLPKSIKGLKITIAAISDEVDGKYEQAIDSITFSTPAPDEDDDNNDNNSSNSDSSSNSPSADNSNGAGNITDSNTNNPSEEANESPTDTDAITDNSTEKSNSNEGASNSSAQSPTSNKDIENMINGCFASTSISAIIIISTIFGFATIKKKKD